MTKRRSKKRSGGKSGSPGLPDPADPIVPFLDRSLGKRAGRILREAGLTLETHDDHFPQDTPDDVWIAEIGKRGWIGINRDRRILYHRIAKMAVEQAGVGLFVLASRKSLTADGWAEIILKARKRIERYARKHPRPFIVRVLGDGTLKEWPSG